MVIEGGLTDHTIVNFLGVEDVDAFSVSLNAVIHRGGREIVDGGTSNSTDIMGGRETVFHSGAVNDATIDNFGQLEVLRGGHANDVTFAGPGLILLDKPTGLTGTITNWRVGDVLDLAQSREVTVESISQRAAQEGQRPDRHLR